MILAIVGSVALDEGRQKGLASLLISRALTGLKPDLVISGGAKGIDSLAKKLADDLDIPIKEFLPTNRRWKPDGFQDRNIKIAEACTHLLSIRTSQSKTYGSGWTADYAESLGKSVARKLI